MSFPFGVCQWCLRHESAQEQVALASEAAFTHIHLGVMHGPQWVASTLSAVEQTRLQVTGLAFGFPGESYRSFESVRSTVGLLRQASPLDPIAAAATAARSLRTRLITTHLGLLGEDDDADLARARSLLSEAAAVCREAGVRLAFETGQSPARLLRELLEQVGSPELGVNLDTGNFLIYGTDEPARAISVLRELIVHVHIKDAESPPGPGQLGAERPLGTGEVDIPRCISKLRAVGYEGPLVLEMESAPGVEQLIEARGMIEQMFE